MREVLILQRLATSPFARPWLWSEDAVFCLRILPSRRGLSPDEPLPTHVRERPEEVYTIATNAGQPLVRFGAPSRADGEVRCREEDLEAMLSGQTPPGEVVLGLGSREVPPWRAQARGVLLLAALGWAGPWPDPDAEEDHELLVRAALLDLSIGRADARLRLFSQGGPAQSVPFDLGGVELRVRDGARGRELNTEGLSWLSAVSGAPRRPAELGTVLSRGEGLIAGLRRLRAAALWQAERGGFPSALPLGDRGAVLTVAPHPLFPSGMPLPRGRIWLLDVVEHPAPETIVETAEKADG